jgi:hypothetical protein
MPTDVSTPLPMLELGPGATIQVDTGDPGAIVTGLTIYGTFYPPDASAPATPFPLFVPVPVDEGT